MTGQATHTSHTRNVFADPISFCDEKWSRSARVLPPARARHARQKNHNRAQEEPSAVSKSKMRTMCRLPTILSLHIASIWLLRIRLVYYILHWRKIRRKKKRKREQKKRCYGKVAIRLGNNVSVEYTKWSIIESDLDWLILLHSLSFL